MSLVVCCSEMDSNWYGSIYNDVMAYQIVEIVTAMRVIHFYDVKNKLQTWLLPHVLF